MAQKTTGGIQGSLERSLWSGRAKTTVDVKGSSLVGSKEAQTGSAGCYRFANLPSGTYTITVAAQGTKVETQIRNLSTPELTCIDSD